MIVGSLRIQLNIPDSQSLKDKRQVVRSLIARIRNKFEVAVSEVDTLDSRQIATIGLATVSNSYGQIEEVLNNIQNFVHETRPDVIITDVQTESMSLG